MPQKERTSLLTQTKTRGPKQLTKLLFESIQRADQAFALLDPNGTLIFANKAWESFTHQYKGISVRIGDNYLDLCQRLSPQVAYAGQAYQALTNLYDEKKEHDSFESDPSTTQSLSKFTSQFWRSPLGEQPYITISHKTTAPQTQAPTSHPSKAEKKEGIFHLFFSAFQVSPNPIMITDTQGYIKWVNPAWSEITGYEPQEVLGKTPSFLSSGKQNSQHYKRLWKKLLQGESWEGEFHNRRKDGTLYDAKTTITPIKDEKKHLTHFVSIQQDITHQRHIENELFQSKERFDRAMKATSEGLWDIDLQTKEIYLSERFEELLGYPQDEIPRDITKLVDFIHKADTQRFIQSIKDWLQGHQTQHTWEIRLRKACGVYIWIQGHGLITRDEDGHPMRITGAITDITGRKKVEEKLRFDARHDALTGLPNRIFFYEKLRKMVARFQKDPAQKLALLLIDLDNFKQINDTLGHQVGDCFLQEIGVRLKETIGPNDQIARLGGDEFAILLSHASEKSVPLQMAQKLLQAISQPVIYENFELKTEGSIGVVHPQTPPDDINTLFQEADVALYKAKSMGRGIFVFFDNDMYQQILKRTEIERSLQHAQERQEFQLYLQPIISLSTGKIKSFEGLIRWRHHKKGMISPAEFIPIAEESGQIFSISEWVLREACRIIEDWQQRTPNTDLPSFSINTSAREWGGLVSQKFIKNDDSFDSIESNTFYQRFKNILREGRALPHNIAIELTESALLSDVDKTAVLLKEFAQDGFQLMLDDFGTGYSSLSYLHKLPFHTVKLDRAFVKQVPQDPRSSALFKGIVSMTKSLGMEVVAEGVETLEQLDFLRQAGVDKVQGYLFSPPVPQEQAYILWKEQRLWC